MGLVRRILVFTLVLTLPLVGIPLPAHAATGEEAPPLTFNGRPLSEQLHGRATGAPFPLPALVHQDLGGDVIRWEQRQSVIARQPTSLNSLSGMQKIAIGAGIGAGMMFWLSKGLAPDTGFPWRDTTTGAAIGAAIVYKILLP